MSVRLYCHIILYTQDGQLTLLSMSGVLRDSLHQGRRKQMISGVGNARKAHPIFYRESGSTPPA